MSTDPGADLRNLLHDSLDDLQPPTDLHRGVIARGRVARRRRRALTIGGGVAALAVGAALVVPLAAGGGGDVDTAVAGDPSLSTPSQSPSQSPTPGAETPSPAGPSDGTEGEAYSPPPGWWDAPSDELLADLEDLLPADVTVRKADTKSEGYDGKPIDGVGFVRATLDSPFGPGGFEILLYPPEGDEVPGAPYRSRLSCPGNQARYDACTVLRDENGERIGRVSTTTPGDITIHEVALLGPDGGLVYGATANSTDEKWGGTSAPSGTLPPLRAPELRDLVEDETWTSYQP
ncbi:hypothetical protein FXB39_16910 [Nocardioides sp. BGMRC 2183]|nr:hypothetical protein FXB39_16910 [Nocardioides sp. BGMRC 2183]